jgi:hypothetical protein
MERGTLQTHDLDDNTLSSATVKLRIENLLPGTEIQFCSGDRHNDLVMDENALQMGVSVGLSCPVMFV